MRKLFVSTLTAMSMLAALVIPMTASAAGFDVCSQGASAGGNSSICQSATGSSPDEFKKIMQNIINTILLVLGMIAVIMIIIGGIRYTTSNGDPAQTKSAKDTVMYAVIGLVVAIMAYAIVYFVLGRFTGK